MRKVFHLSLIGLLAIVTNLHAEQKRTFGEYEVHYIILPTTDLNTKIAAQYNLTRAKDRALVNLSVLDKSGVAQRATIDGHSENLLGQRQVLEFNEVTEGTAVYYLSQIRHADEEFHRVTFNVTLPNGEIAELKFQQQMFWDRE